MTDDLPIHSALYRERGLYRYRDSFSVPLHRRDVEPWELVATFFQAAPAWLDRLFVLRNRLVRHFGLKTGEEHERNIHPPFQVGQHIGLFRILHLSDREAVLGEDDRHLDFRISLLLSGTESQPLFTVSTLVQTKNLLGVAYLGVVKPFHRLLIVPVTVKAMAKKLDERSLAL